MKTKKDYKNLLKSMLLEWKWIFNHSSRYKTVITVYILLGVVGVALSLVSSVVTKNLVDAILNHISEGLVLKCVTVALCTACQIGFTALTSWISASVGTKVNNELRSECYSDVIFADWQLIGKYHSGELINRLEGDVNSVSSVIIGFIPGLITKLVQFTASFFVLLYYDWVMALLSLLSAPILFLSSRFMVRTMRKFNKESRELNGKILSFTEESVQNLQLIKAFELKKKYISDFGILLGEYRKVKLNYEKFSILMTLMLSSVGMIVSFACYGWAAYRLWGNLITVGTLTLFIQLSGFLSSSFSSLAAMVPGSISIATAAGRLKEICSIKAEKSEDVTNVDSFLSESDDKKITLNVENCCFSYRKEKNVLSDINLDCSTGDMIAIIGKSGIGKTTFLKLLLGLIHPEKGFVIVKNQKGEMLEIDETTRKLFSYVPQEPCIFSGSLSDNLRLGKCDATDEELRNALNTVDLLDYFSSLPDGINTLLGERGANLSTGQAQRVSIARALLKDSVILLFDEATSALDKTTEQLILENIREYCSDKILLFTTHKQDIINYCDKSLTIQ